MWGNESTIRRLQQVQQHLCIRNPRALARNLCCGSGDTVSSPQISLPSWWQEPPKESDLTERKKKKEYPGSLLGVAGHTKARLPQLVHYTQPIKSIPEMNSTSTGKIGRRLPVTAISRITSLRWAPPSLNHCPCWRIRWPNGWTCLPGVLQAPENCLLRKGSLSKHIRTGRPTLAHNYFYWLFLLFAL